MSVLTNIVEDLKPYFTLKYERNSKWLEYLKNGELSYVNGSVYLNENAPVYYVQENPDLFFEARRGVLVCKLYCKDTILRSQVVDTVITLDGVKLDTGGLLLTENGKSYGSYN